MIFYANFIVLRFSLADFVRSKLKQNDLLFLVEVNHMPSLTSLNQAFLEVAQNSASATCMPSAAKRVWDLLIFYDFQYDFACLRAR